MGKAVVRRAAAAVSWEGTLACNPNPSPVAPIQHTHTHTHTHATDTHTCTHTRTRAHTRTRTRTRTHTCTCTDTHTHIYAHTHTHARTHTHTTHTGGCRAGTTSRWAAAPCGCGVLHLLGGASVGWPCSMSLPCLFCPQDKKEAYQARLNGACMPCHVACLAVQVVQRRVRFPAHSLIHTCSTRQVPLLLLLQLAHTPSLSAELYLSHIMDANAGVMLSLLDEAQEQVGVPLIKQCLIVLPAAAGRGLLQKRCYKLLYILAFLPSPPVPVQHQAQLSHMHTHAHHQRRTWRPCWPTSFCGVARTSPQHCARKTWMLLWRSTSALRSCEHMDTRILEGLAPLAVLHSLGRCKLLLHCIPVPNMCVHAGARSQLKLSTCRPWWVLLLLSPSFQAPGTCLPRPISRSARWLLISHPHPHRPRHCALVVLTHSP